MKTSKTVLIIISLFLLIIPFFWMRPGEIDMGGDGGSLYFYDPINYIRHVVLYKISPFGTGETQNQYYYLPFTALLMFLKVFLSSHLLSTLHNSMKLVVGFLSIYGIMKLLLSLSREKAVLLQDKFNKIEIVSILTGVFYIFLPIFTEYDRYVNALSTHDQVFLNPLIFYLIFKFILTKKWKYLGAVLGISFIFSHNFSYTAAPAVFSFYPFALLFLVFFAIGILKKKLPIKEMLIGILLFILLHFFHLGPEVSSLFDPASDINVQTFSKEVYKQQSQYFYGVMHIASLVKSILLPSITGSAWLLLAFVSPLVILLGFLKNRFKSRLFLLTGVFFLITLFLVSAKISYTGIKLYEMFFLYIPGFVMFRNFYIQWMYIFAFFYTLMFGQALFLIYSSLDNKKIKLISLMLAIYLIGSAWLFINGHQFNPPYVGSNDVRRHVIMDPQYEKMLEFIRNVPFDGKLLQFPFGDFSHQVVHGLGDGAYIGTTSIGQLTGIKDFAGYWQTPPYSEPFLQLAKEKNYEKLYEILGLLNIRYIFHNADTRVYDANFTRPFEYTKTFLPATQKEYEKFIAPLVGEKVFESGPYSLYLTKEESYVPHIYIPKKTEVYKYDPKYDKYYNAASSFLIDPIFATNSARQSTEKRVAYVEKNGCLDKPLLQVLCSQDVSFDNLPNIYFKKISPVKYIVKVKNIQKPFLLIFSDVFHKDWKLFISQNNIEESPIKTYFNGDILEGKPEDIFFDKKTLETMTLSYMTEAQHIVVNSYANGWYIMPQDIGNKQEATFIVEMTGQRLFYIASMVSLISFIGVALWISMLFLIKKFKT